VIRHEERAAARKGWRGVGFVRARRSVEVVPVDETFGLDLEALESKSVAPNDDDSGRIEVLADGSVSIPIYVEELVVTRRSVLKERIIIRKEIATRSERIQTELRREHVDIEAEGEAEIIEEGE
jgi:stress response protein YsnF